MKRWLSLAAILGCFGVSAPSVAPANYDGFGIALLQRLATASRNQNVFISPLSIGVALSMAADGAAGNTRIAILRTLHQAARLNLSDANAALITEILGNSDAKVGLADAIWLRAKDPPGSAYVTLLKQKYRAEVRAVRFGDPDAVKQINAWVKAHTLGMIDHLVDRTTPDDYAFLTNALAFQGRWTQPFTKNATQPHPFTNSDGSITKVAMMSQVGIFATTEAPAFRALRMSYGHRGFTAYVILPRTNDAAGVLRQLTPRSFGRAINAMQPRYLRVSIPRFTAQLKTNLNDVLKAMGMATAFSPNADFTRMNKSGEIYIKNVEHASYVRVDEEGTTAAAATSVELAKLGVIMRPRPPAAFMVDHPFILAIRDEHTRSLLFIGVINNVL